MRKTSRNNVVTMPMKDEGLAEIRAINRRVAEAYQKLGQIDFAVAQLESQRAQGRADVAKEDAELKRLIANYAASKGIDVSAGVWRLNPETGEFAQGA